MRESELEDYLVRRFTLAGGETRKVQWIGRRGAPDRFGMLPHWNGFIELKAPGQQLRPEQLREHERLRKYNINVLTIDNKEMIDELCRVRTNVDN